MGQIFCNPKIKNKKTKNVIHIDDSDDSLDNDSIIIARVNMRERAISFRDPDPPNLVQRFSEAVS